jgi:hypothetical protein
MLGISGAMAPGKANIYLILVDIWANLGWGYWLWLAAARSWRSRQLVPGHASFSYVSCGGYGASGIDPVTFVTAPRAVGSGHSQDGFLVIHGQDGFRSAAGRMGSW